MSHLPTHRHAHPPLRLAALLLLGLLGAAVPAHAAPGDWPLYGHDLGNRRHSPLSQIDRGNVATLQPAWSYHSGIRATFQATPLVVDGVMYLSLPFNHVVALDARNGRELWRYQHERRKGYRLCCGPANRGVAVSGGRVFIGTVDARLVALDAASGKVLWDRPVAADKNARGERLEDIAGADTAGATVTVGATGVGISMAPQVFEDKVIVGITGVGFGLHLDSPREGAPLGAVVGVAGDYGRPGFLAAYDAATGQPQWQFDTIAAHGWEGDFTPTTPDGLPLNRDLARERADAPRLAKSAHTGGGSAWSTPAIDPQLGLLYFGTGNPSPQMDDVSRPGDNLYTISLVALDVRTGQRRWHFQQVPHDRWGYDVASPPVLFSYRAPNGKRIDAVGQASKTGFFYAHERATGQLLYRSQTLVPQEGLFTPPTPEGVVIRPGALGGVNWSPVALDESRRLAFAAAIDWPVRYRVGVLPATADKPAQPYSTLEPLEGERSGNVSAIDLDTGRLRWQLRTPQPMIGGLLATAGGLVFAGEGNGRLSAIDADSGKVLWQHQGASGVNAPPITYEVDGVQYIAVAAGGSQIFGFPTGDELRVYALPRP